jgi:hypothetical protein
MSRGQLARQVRMDSHLYQHYLEKYVQEAIIYSNGSKPAIAEYLHSIRIGRYLVRHKLEKERALADARQAFDEHRHWPLEIILSHLGVTTIQPPKK